MLADNDPRIAGFVDLIVVYSIPSSPAAPAVLSNTMGILMSRAGTSAYIDLSWERLLTKGGEA